MTSAGKEMQNKYNLPDFAELVHKEFSGKLAKSAHDWPELIMESNAIGDDSAKPSGCLLTIRVVAVVSDSDGLQTHTMAQMTDSNENILWQKRVSYKSSDLNRPCSFEELEADNARLLHGEIAFAVEKTSQELIDHLNNRSDVRKTVENPEKKSES
jgi:hypothetical protein